MNILSLLAGRDIPRDRKFRFTEDPVDIEQDLDAAGRFGHAEDIFRIQFAAEAGCIIDVAAFDVDHFRNGVDDNPHGDGFIGAFDLHHDDTGPIRVGHGFHVEF